MEQGLLPTEQSELAKAQALADETSAALRKGKQAGLSSLRWWLPAAAFAVAVYAALGGMGAPSYACGLLAIVSAFAVSAGIQVQVLTKRLNALEALVRLQEVRTRHRLLDPTAAVPSASTER